MVDLKEFEREVLERVLAPATPGVEPESFPNRPVEYLKRMTAEQAVLLQVTTGTKVRPRENFADFALAAEINVLAASFSEKDGHLDAYDLVKLIVDAVDGEDGMGTWFAFGRRSYKAEVSTFYLAAYHERRGVWEYAVQATFTPS